MAQSMDFSKQLYDFHDGNGLVSAHRHPNGGGWVSDTAHVSETAYVGVCAMVYGYATVRDGAVLSDCAEVSAFSVIKDQAHIKDSSVIRGSSVIAGSTIISGSSFINKTVTMDEPRVFHDTILLATREDCLSCPALMGGEGYDGAASNACMECQIKHHSAVRNISESSGADTVL